MVDVRYWVWLSIHLNPNFKHTDKLLSAFGDAKNIYNATCEDYIEAGLSEELSARLSDKNVEETNSVYNYCIRNQVGLLPYDSEMYPERLRKICNPPILLYFKGSLPNFDDNVCIATVGTRRITEYGKREAYTITYDLTSAGAIIISGLARGIDTVCHNACIDAYGKTVAILGSGIDVVYPKENDLLYAQIVQNGAVMTEYVPGTSPLPQNFPQRNRIISGLSLGTLVLEADQKSGALITAKTTLSQGRDIFSLPGKVGELNSTGTNNLIKNGAKMITCATDILEEYECLFPHRIRIENIPISPKKFKTSSRFSSSARSKAKSDGSDQFKNTSKDDSKKLINEQMNNEPSCAQSDDTVLPDTSSLDEISIKVLKKMKRYESVSPDELVDDDLSISDIMVAMTILEINKFVSNLPGGMFVRN